MRNLLAVSLCCLAVLGCRHGRERRLRLATTTSTRDSGLLDRLIPAFEKRASVRVDVIALGTGRALKVAEVGDVDVVLVHARAEEEAFMRAHYGSRREDVMYNNFEILGPSTDPAQIKNLGAVEAFQRIAAGGHRFVSRGDDSGTHQKEMAIWDAGGGLVRWPRYLESGQGMGSSLVMADEKEAYILTDRGTYLAFRSKIHLVPLVAPSNELGNPYGVMVVNPKRHPHVNEQRANALVDFLISREGQEIIGNFKVNGERLFHPAHRPADD